MPVDVLNGDGRVVDENADRQRETAERHQVDGLAEGVEDDEGRDDGQRDGDGDDKGAAPAAQEQQHHECRETGGEHRLDDDALHCGTDEHGLVSGRVDRCAGRQQLAHPGQACTDFVDNIERGCRAGFLDRHQYGTPAIHTHNVRLRGMAVVYEGDVADVGDVAIDLPSDRQIVYVIDLEGARVELDVIFGVADFLRASRHDQILIVYRVIHVVGGESLCAQGIGPQVDLHLAGRPTVGIRNGGAIH